MNRMQDHPRGLGAIGDYHRTAGSDDSKGFFAVSGRANIEYNDAPTDGISPRCDEEKQGPYGFHRWEGNACNCGRLDAPDLEMGHHILTMENLEYVTIVMSSASGYILYFECSPAIEAQALDMRHSDCARTLQELFRAMVEWDYAYTELSNRELVAVTCRDMLNELNFPQTLRDWLLANIPDQKVSRFLQGNPEARVRDMSVPDLSDDLNDWLTSQMLFAEALGERNI